MIDLAQEYCFELKAQASSTAFTTWTDNRIRKGDFDQDRLLDAYRNRINVIIENGISAGKLEWSRWDFRHER